jgi:hypothetical protein
VDDECRPALSSPGVRETLAYIEDFWKNHHTKTQTTKRRAFARYVLACQVAYRRSSVASIKGFHKCPVT